MQLFFTSWPGLAGPSTSFLLVGKDEDVDGPNKSGHDEMKKSNGVVQPL
jgi:hypothetical protein